MKYQICTKGTYSLNSNIGGWDLWFKVKIFFLQQQAQMRIIFLKMTKYKNVGQEAPKSHLNCENKKGCKGESPSLSIR